MPEPLGQTRILSLLLAALLCNCTFSRDKREDSHIEVQEHAQQKAAQQTTETRTEGPETVTTTIEEFGDGSPQEAKAEASARGLPAMQGIQGRTGLQDGQEKALQPASKRISASPVLIRRTVVVDQRGPISDTKASKATETASEDVGLDLARHTDLRSKSAPALAGFLWIALLVVAIGGAAWLAWRFSLPGRVMELFK